MASAEHFYTARVSSDGAIACSFILRFCNLLTHILLLIQVGLYISDNIGAALKAEMNASNLNNCTAEHNRFFILLVITADS